MKKRCGAISLVVRESSLIPMPSSIWVILQKVRNSCPTPKYLYIFILVQISCFWKFVFIKAFDYLTITTVTGILTTGVHIYFLMNYGVTHPPPPPIFSCSMVKLQFDKNAYINKTNWDAVIVFGRNLPMADASYILLYWVEAVPCLFRYVPHFVSSLLPQLQVYIIQNYYL